MNLDPMGFAAQDTDLYRYVDNDPTDEVDPTGMDDDKSEGRDPVRVATHGGQRSGTSENRNVPDHLGSNSREPTFTQNSQGEQGVEFSQPGHGAANRAVCQVEGSNIACPSWTSCNRCQ